MPVGLDESRRMSDYVCIKKKKSRAHVTSEYRISKTFRILQTPVVLISKRAFLVSDQWSQRGSGLLLIWHSIHVSVCLAETIVYAMCVKQ